MEQDLAQYIVNKNRQTLVYCEVDQLLIQLKIQKPHLNILQYKFSQHKFPTNNFCDNGATIILTVFDTKLQIKKSLKILFLERFKNKKFIDDVFHLFQGMKTLLRNDIILQIYDLYFIKYNNVDQAYFVIESENIEAKLQDYKMSKDCPKEILKIMNIAIHYCSDLTNIKLISTSNNLTFPSSFIEYFYIVKEENDEIKIKLNILSPEIFMNLQQNFRIQNNQLFKTTYRYKEGEHFQFEQLNQQLNKLEINTQKLTLIKKENLIQTIKEYGQLLLNYHDLQIFEIIAQHPKYDDFELKEFDEQSFILGSKIQGQDFLLKAEKFLTQKQLEDTYKKYDLYYSIEDYIFVPVENYESIILENSYYLLIQEKVLTNISHFQYDQTLNFSNQYIPLKLKLQQKEINKKDKLRNLQIALQLIRFVIDLHNFEIYHGQLNIQNIFVQTPQKFTQQPPEILISNPLFMREKVEQNRQLYFSFEQDIIDIKNVIFELLDCFNYGSILIDLGAVNEFKNQISIYFQQLIKQSYPDQNFIKEKDIPFDYMIKKLEFLIKIFEAIFDNNLFDDYVKLNQKWLISLNYQVYERDEDDSKSKCKKERFKSKDEKNYFNLFELNVDEIKQNFYYRNDEYDGYKEYEEYLDVFDYICDYSELLSLNIKQIYLDSYFIKKLSWFLGNSTKLQKLILVATIQYGEELKLSLLKDLVYLKQIKLQIGTFSKLSSQSYEEFIQMLIQNLDDLILVFQTNKQFTLIKIVPNRYLPSQYNSDEDFSKIFEKYKTIYEQINNRLIQLTSYEETQQHNNNKKFLIEENSLNTKDQDQNQQKENLKGDSQSNGRQKILNQQQIIILDKQKFDVQSTQYIEFVDNDQIKENILNRENMINQFKQEVYTYFNLFKSEQQCAILLDGEQKLLQQINYLINSYKYINFQAQTNIENNQQLLILEFKNILNDDIGKLIIKLNINNSKQLKIYSFDCNKNYERYFCEQKNSINQSFQSDQVINWMKYDYKSQLIKQLYPINENQSCKHYEYIIVQRKFYKDQLSLRKLSIYLEFCENIIKHMMNTVNYFQFSPKISETLIELEINFMNGYQFPNYFWKHLRNNLESAKSLIKIQIQRKPKIYIDLQQIERQLMKMKRLVYIK